MDPGPAGGRLATVQDPRRGEEAAAGAGDPDVGGDDAGPGVRRAGGAAGGDPHGGQPGGTDVALPEQRPGECAAGGGGEGARAEVLGRGEFEGRQERGGDGPIRGAVVGGLAPSHDAVAAGVVVPGIAEPPRRKKTRLANLTGDVMGG